MVEDAIEITTLEPSISMLMVAALDLLLLISGSRARHSLPAASLFPTSMVRQDDMPTAAHL
jgi:hypothetical protein